MKASNPNNLAFKSLERQQAALVGRAHSLRLTCHQVGPEHFEMRACVRDKGGVIIGASRSRRYRPKWSAYDDRQFFVGVAELLRLRLEECRWLPDILTEGPTYPRAGDDPGHWHTEAPRGVVLPPEFPQSSAEDTFASFSHALTLGYEIDKAYSLTFSWHRISPAWYEGHVCIRAETGNIIAVCRSVQCDDRYSEPKWASIRQQLSTRLSVPLERCVVLSDLYGPAPMYPLAPGVSETWSTEYPVATRHASFTSADEFWSDREDARIVAEAASDELAEPA